MNTKQAIPEQEWSKIVRVKRDIHETDRLHGRRLVNNEMLMVRFPDSEVRQLPCIVTRVGIMVDSAPYISMQEKVYFAVAYRGLSEVWVRGIDVEVMAVVEKTA